MAANDSKSYLPYLNKLVDQKNINADYSALTEKIKTNRKISKFKINDRVRITKDKNIFKRNICYWLCVEN